MEYMCLRHLTLCNPSSVLKVQCSTVIIIVFKLRCRAIVLLNRNDVVYVWFIKQHPLYGLINYLYNIQKHLTPFQKENTLVMQTHKHRDKQCKKNSDKQGRQTTHINQCNKHKPKPFSWGTTQLSICKIMIKNCLL